MTAPGAITLDVLSGDDWRLWRELRQQALGEAPYAFSSTLADWQGPRDLESRWRRRLTDVPFNVAARLGGAPAGMASGVAPDARGTVELISMWVAPFARGRGVGAALIDAVVGWARQQNAAHVGLSVRQRNAHAIALYARAGFVDAGAVDDTCPEALRERRMVRPC